MPIAPSLKIGRHVQDECVRRGFIVRRLADRIAWTPPLILPADGCREIVRLLRRSLDGVRSEIRQERLVAAE